MPVTYVDAGQARGSDGANASIVKPGAFQQGDYLLAGHVIDMDGIAAYTTAMTLAGFTEIHSGTVASCNAVKIWEKWATASEPANYVFGTDTSNQADLAAGIVGFRGVDPTTPRSTPTATTNTGTADVNHTAPSQAGVPGGMVVTFHTGGNGTENTKSYLPGAGLGNATERVDPSSLGTSWVGLAIYTEPTTSTDPTGTRTATAAVSSRHRSVTVVLNPASGGGGGRAAVDLTRVGAGAWVSGAVNPTPAYPDLLAEDVAYLWVENKPSTITPPTPAGWTLVGTFTGGAGTNAADTGLTRVTIFKQVLAADVTAGTTVALTLTGNSVAAACIVGYRATGTNLAYEEAAGSWQKTSTTGTTGYGGTTSPAVPVAAKDIVEWVHGSPSDAVTITPSAIAASGATFGSIGSNSGIRTATGNDLSADGDYAAVTAGSSSVGPTVTAGSSGSASAIGVLMRVRATADVATVDTSRFFLAAA